MIEMMIDSIRVSMTNYQRVVILKEKSYERYLPIWIGSADADAIAIKLQGISLPRPLSHDLLLSIIYTLGAVIDHITICDVKDDTFYAKIYLRVNAKMLEIDSRPSDALALAVRVSAPIYVDQSVMEKTGILLDKNTGKAIPQVKKQIENGGKPANEIEMKNLSAFEDFIRGLNRGDLEKGDKPEGS